MDLIELADQIATEQAGTGMPRPILHEMFSRSGLAEALVAPGTGQPPSAAEIFDAFAYPGRGALREQLEQHFEVVALPRASLEEELRAGDMLVRRADGNQGHFSVIATPELRSCAGTHAEGLVPETYTAGQYAHVVETGFRPHALADAFARRVVDAAGRMPYDQLVLRPRLPMRQAIENVWTYETDDLMSPYPSSAFSGFNDPIAGVDGKLEDAFKGALQAVKDNADYHDPVPSLSKLPIIIVALKSDGTRPHVGQNVDKMYYSGSLLKIAAMFAAFQLRHAVNALAASMDAKKITDKDLFFNEVRRVFDGQIFNASDVLKSKGVARGNQVPKYELIFKATKGSNNKFTVAFASSSDKKLDFAGHLDNMIVNSHNPSAGFCIQALGYGWINGLLQKCGLFRAGKEDNGIWLAGDYLHTQSFGQTAHDAAAKGDADGKEEYALGISGWAEIRIPSENDGPAKQATTCLDAARLLVALKDGKLVENTASAPDTANTDMQDLLKRAVSKDETGGAPSITWRRPSKPAPFDVLQSKIGVGYLGKTPACLGATTKGCVYSEALVVKQTAEPHREFVVVWQDVQDPRNRSYKDISRIRDIILKTMEDYKPATP